jgi:serine protease inhibitor ecotin
MNMPLTVHTCILTDGTEKRLEGNTFQLELEGYHLYVLGSLQTVQKTAESQPSGKAEVKEITWKEEKTFIKYELVDLHNVN